MIATVTKRWVTIGNLPTLTGGTEVEVYPEPQQGYSQVHYTDPEGTLHVAYNVKDTWLASVTVYRRAKDLGYGN